MSGIKTQVKLLYSIFECTDVIEGWLHVIEGQRTFSGDKEKIT